MTVLRFLSELAKDPSRQLQFRQNPAATARASGLPEPVVAVLASRDSAQLRALLAESTDRAMIYSTETSVVYSTETAMIYSSESPLVYSPETA